VTTDTPPKPNRRRWRWLVAGAIVASLVSATAAWKIRPYTDVRFVGRWQEVWGDDDVTLISNELELKSDGSGTRTNGGGTVFPLAWRVQAGQLHVDKFPASPLRVVAVRPDQLILYSDGHQFLLRLRRPGHAMTESEPLHHVSEQ